MSRVPCPLPHPGPPGRAARADDDRQAALSKLLQRQERRSGWEDAAQQDERVGNVPEQVRLATMLIVQPSVIVGKQWDQRSSMSMWLSSKMDKRCIIIMIKSIMMSMFFLHETIIVSRLLELSPRTNGKLSLSTLFSHSRR